MEAEGKKRKRGESAKENLATVIGRNINKPIAFPVHLVALSNAFDFAKTDVTCRKT